MKVVTLKINNVLRREKLLVGLGEAGHRVWVEEAENTDTGDDDFFVCVEVSDDCVFESEDFKHDR